MADLTGKTISELPLDSPLSGDELFPVMDNSTSKRVAISTLDSRYRMTAVGTKVEAGTNIDEMLTPGTYFVATPGNVTGGTPPPAGGSSYKLIVDQGFTMSGGKKRLWQIALVLSNNCREYRRNYDGTTWGDWVYLDYGSVNSQLDALGGGAVSFSRFTVSANGNLDVTIASGTHGMIFFTNYADTGRGCGVFAFYCTSTGAVVVNALVDAPLLTISKSTNTINVASESSYPVYGLLVSY